MLVSRQNGAESYMKPGACTYSTGTLRALQEQPSARRAATFLLGLLCLAATLAYTSPFPVNGHTVASGLFAVLGEDGASGRPADQGQPGFEEMGDDVELFSQIFGAWRESSRSESEPASARFAFRGDPLTPQSLERPPPGR